MLSSPALLRKCRCTQLGPSQANRRTTDLLRLQGISRDCLVQSPSSEKGQPEEATQDHVQLRFEYLQRQRLHNFSRERARVFNLPYRFLLYLNGISCVPVCGHCLFSFCWVTLGRIWIQQKCLCKQHPWSWPVSVGEHCQAQNRTVPSAHHHLPFGGTERAEHFILDTLETQIAI